MASGPLSGGVATSVVWGGGSGWSGRGGGTDTRNGATVIFLWRGAKCSLLHRSSCMKERERIPVVEALRRAFPHSCPMIWRSQRAISFAMRAKVARCDWIWPIVDRLFVACVYGGV